MKVLPSQIGEAQVLALTGRLDSEAAPEFERQCLREIRDETKTLILDLTGLVRELRLHQDRIHDQLRDSFSPETSPDAASLKVVLATIDRAIADWVRLKEIFSDNEDALLDMLVHLDRLRRALRQLLPP